MNKTLTSLVLAGTASLSSGCTATYLANKDFVYESKESSVTNRDGQYTIPSVTLAGKELNPQVSYRQENGELPIFFKPSQTEGSWIVKDRKNRTIDLETKTVFVTPIYLNSAGNPATEVYFNTKGRFALNAKVNRERNSKEIAVKNFTHNDLEYEIATISIDTDNDKKTPKEEFYIPVILTEREEIKDILLIPVDGTKELIDPVTGRIMLRTSPGNIHFLKEINSDAYFARLINVPSTQENKGTETPATITPAVIAK
ncbi:MAG: hypothetical protein AABX94_01095 [Nanoarchaeota archaeon]